MARLELTLIFVLQFEVGIAGRFIFRYNRPGEDATLPCPILPPDTKCNRVSWIYNKNQSQTFTEVESGNVMKSSARAARLSVDTECSLVINNVTAEDIGLYTCQLRRRDEIQEVLLCVITISPSPPDDEPERDDEVTLECSLLRHSIRPCEPNSIHWVDETGSVLRGEGVGYRVLGQTDCVSVLTVKRQSGHNRRYTCQFVNDNVIRTEADYTPVFTYSQTETSDQGSPLSHIMMALRIAGLSLMIVITVLVIRNRWKRKPLDDNEANNEDEGQYENVG